MHKVFKIYVNWLILSALALLALTSSLVLYAHSMKIEPPPAISNSISFDEKALFLHNRGGIDAKVIAIGSSMTLRNLDSVQISHMLVDQRDYVNLAAWSLKIRHTDALTRNVLDISQPKMVITVIGLSDFYYDSQPDEFYDASVWKEFIQGKRYWLTVAQKFEITTFVTRLYEARRYRASRKNGGTLKYDEWGGCMFDLVYPNVPKKRWNLIYKPQQVDQINYEKLEVLSKYLQSKGVKYVIAQAPCRTTAFPTEYEQKAAEEHWHKVSEIAKSSGAIFINMHGVLDFDDTHFVDYTHLNQRGARVFTDALLKDPQISNELKSINNQN